MDSISITRPKTAQDKAYAFIKERIINLDCKAGEPLRAQELAKRLGLSRTPVREALGRLQQEGLIRRDSGWGYVVRAMTQKEITDLFKLRETLEVTAALEALKYLDEEQLQRLSRLLDEAAKRLKGNNLSKCRALNRDFRMALASASRNTLLYQMLLIISDRVRWLGSLHVKMRPVRVQESLEENREILRALRSGDSREVRKAVLKHIRRAREGVIKHAAPLL